MNTLCVGVACKQSRVILCRQSDMLYCTVSVEYVCYVCLVLHLVKQTVIPDLVKPSLLSCAVRA